MDAEELFVRFFLPLYPADARTDLARARAEDTNPGRNPSVTAHLTDAAEAFVHNAGALFGRDLALDRSDASVHRLSAALTPARRDAWAARGDAGTADNVLFNVAVHGAAYVGACIVAGHGGAWSVRRPLWESVVRLASRAGEADLAVFHWWLKSLADDSAGASLADRYRAHVEVPCSRLEDLPVFIDGRRAPPRLKQPRYDLLHKYVRAHLPELRDLGEHFPSPERFEEYRFRWLDAHVVGDGRMVLFVAASAHGLHLIWLTAAGFEKSAFVPCESFPDPVVKVDGERVVALTSESGAQRRHEWLWWGP
ncbi:MAG: hypothetical protein ACRELB_03230 [Polyangiaceae bacterium]